jgi:hypothetical protein
MIMDKYPSVSLMLVALAVFFSANVCGQEVLAKFETKWDNETEPEGTYMTGVAAISAGDDDPHLHITDAVNGANGGFMIEDFTDGAAFKDFEISFRLHMTDISLDGTERVTFRISDSGTEREYLVGNEMQLKMGEMYGERQLVKLDGMLPLVGRTLQIGQYERKPFGFSFETVTGGNYVVEFSQDLKEWGQLQEYKGTGKLINFVDSRPPSLPSGKSFYRIRIDQ